MRCFSEEGPPCKVRLVVSSHRGKGKWRSTSLDLGSPRTPVRSLAAQLMVAFAYCWSGEQRCKAGNHECVFEESNRGKKSSK